MRLTMIVALIGSWSLPAAADFPGGLAAWRRGDNAEALAQWLPDAERGDPNAQYNVGLVYSSGGNGVERDYGKAAEWYRKSAAQGVATAQFNLGLLYDSGLGVTKDPAEAAAWYRKAAEQGLPDAALNLGVLYDEGAGVERSAEEAERWYKTAAQYGMPKAQFNLGLLYDSKHDHANAIEWYRRAAAQGNAGAMKNLGVFYYNGEGVPRDLYQAYTWFARADAEGMEFAGQLRRITAKKMKRGDVDRAEKDLAGWRPTREARDQSPAVTSPVMVPAMGFAPAPR